MQSLPLSQYHASPPPIRYTTLSRDKGSNRHNYFSTVSICSRQNSSLSVQMVDGRMESNNLLRQCQLFQLDGLLVETITKAVSERKLGRIFK